MTKNFFMAATAVFFASAAYGHEGHGVPGEGQTVAHYALDPLHLPMLVVVCVVAIGIANWFRKHIKRSSKVAKR